MAEQGIYSNDQGARSAEHGTTGNRMARELGVIIKSDDSPGQMGLVEPWPRRADSPRSSPPQHPNEPVLIPGDPERLTRAERIKNGVPVDDETWRELTLAARGLNVLVEPPQPRPV
jgi:LDH2 family malate/lactate/ureidoglycolate dehydrogenase